MPPSLRQPSDSPANRLITLPEGVPELTLGWEVVRYAAKYLRQPNGPRVGQRFEFTDNQIRFLLWFYSVDEQGRWLYHHGVRRLSKGPIAHTTPVMTPQGWAKHGDLAVGDEVFAVDGTITTVTDVKPEVHEDCYELTFRDGQKVVCTGSHRWVVDEFVGKHDRIRRTVTVAEMAEAGVSYKRELTKGKSKASAGGVGRWRSLVSPVVAGRHQELPISPYVFGYWLGDGDSDTSRITTGSHDLDFVMRQLESEGASPETPKRTNTAHRIRFGLGWAHVALRELTVLGNKRIPQEYLRASVEQRWALLQGIVDSDGSVNKTGSVEISTKSPQLGGDIFELAVSLGLMPTTSLNEAKLYGKACGTRTRIRFTPQPGEPVCRMPRKLTRVRQAGDRAHAVPQSRSRTIVDIQKVETVPAQCITVAHPSHQYLVGERNVPTCNSGKSPMAAVLALSELCFPVRLKDFDSARPGGCVGKPVSMPWVQIVATNQDQTENTMRMVRAFAPKGSRIANDYKLDPGKLQYFKAPEGKLEVKTSSAHGIEGAESTFVIGDEVEWWTPGRGGHLLASTLHDNNAKSGARMLTTCNAWVPGEDSVAETDYDAWIKQEEGKVRSETKILYDARIIPADTKWDDPESLRKGLEFVYDDCWWVDVRNVMNRIYDPKSRPDDSLRKYGNRPTAKQDSWVSKEEWELLHDPDRKVERHEEVVLFFDGSKSRDATALIGCCVSDGHVFEIRVWEPDGSHTKVKDDEDTNERVVPVAQVDTEIERAFQTWNVRAFFADVKEWESFVKVEWPSRYANQLEIMAVPGGKDPQPIAWDMRGHDYEFGLACELTHGEIVAEEPQFTHDGSSALTRHVTNARNRPNKYQSVAIGKESKDSPLKIDAAVAMIGARMVRRLLLAHRSKTYTGKRPGRFW